MKNQKNIPEVLKLKSKEIFRRKLLITSRILALLLIMAIFFYGYELYASNKENAVIMTKYGDMGHCYICGLETGRQCSCSYVQELVLRGDDFDREKYLENIATSNVMKCENINNKKLEDVNLINKS